MISTIDLFKTIMLIMLFYSVSITLLTQVIPDEAKVYVTGFSDVTQTLNLETVTGQVRNSLESQTNIPVIELGALVFYSGNIILDLLLNFVFAIPEMIGLFINAISMLLSIDSDLFAIVQLFSTAVVTVFYFIGLIQLVTGIRSGRIV